MTHYLVEFRFQGKAKSEIRKLIWEVDRRCKLDKAKEKRPVPHVTLVGPLLTLHERQLLHVFSKLCSNFPLMSFSVDGFDTFEENKVLFLKINPDRELDLFRWSLSREIRLFSDMQTFDYQRKFSFHATIAMGLSYDKFMQVKSYIQRKHSPKFRYTVARVTLLKNGLILREYDFLQRKMLFRSQAKNKETLKRTMSLLQGHFNGESVQNQRLSLWTKIRSFFSIR